MALDANGDINGTKLVTEDGRTTPNTIIITETVIVTETEVKTVTKEVPVE